MKQRDALLLAGAALALAGLWWWWSGRAARNYAAQGFDSQGV